MKQLIGLTGGIGAGKSTVLAELEGMGEKTVDSDEIVHDLYDSDNREVVQPLIQRYGRSILTDNNRIDKKKIAQLVFNDPLERNWLNSLIHPFVLRKIYEIAEDVNSRLFCSVPLLFEVGWQQKFDHTVAVWCDEKNQLYRLRRRGWSMQEIKGRKDSQMTMEEKNDLADFVLVNNCSIDVLRNQLNYYLGIL